MISGKVLNSLSSLNVLVTGGTGLIGRQIVKILCNAKANVKVISLDDINIDENFEHIKADLTDLNICKEITAGVDVVFHLAGIKGSIEVTKSKPASFFVEGLYKYSRNPQYLGYILILSGNVFLISSFKVLKLTIMMFIFVNILIYYVEEPKLRKEFGESYIEYCKKVNRWFTFIK